MSFSLGGNDWLGIGAGHKSRHVEGCGNKPICSGRTDSCKSKLNAFDKCVEREQDFRMASLNANTNRIKSANEAKAKKTKTILIIVGVVVLLIVLSKRS